MQVTSFRLSQIAMVVVAAVCLTGCASKPYKRSNATADAVRNAAAAIQAEHHDLNAALDGLDNLVNQPHSDLRPQFAVYDDAIDRLYDSIIRAEKAVARMREKNIPYFELWDQQLGTMNYGIMREHSKSRKIAVQTQVRVVDKRYIDTREVVLPLLAYLEDIRKTLHADLTIGGVTAIREVANKAISNGRKVELALASLAEQFAESGSQMSSFNVLPATRTRTARVEVSEEKQVEKRAPRSSGRLVGVGGWFKTTFARLKPAKDAEVADAGGTGDEVISRPASGAQSSSSAR